jgi:hypothetical protein
MAVEDKFDRLDSATRIQVTARPAHSHSGHHDDRTRGAAVQVQLGFRVRSSTRRVTVHGANLN